MEKFGSVQQKVSCIFEIAVLDEQSNKRDFQQYKVVATDIIKQTAIDSDAHNARVTEKLDGTCCYITKFEDKPWLWARYDRKPNKGAEKRFKKFQSQQQKLRREDSSQNLQNNFVWDHKKDFKETPPYWIPASGIEISDGSPLPDDIGHTPGWVPISPASRQYCWHLSAVDLQIGLALVLRESPGSDCLFLEAKPLSELEGHTAELIGTNINGNPYGIGSKKTPLHMLVVHGSIGIRNPPRIDSTALREWFQTKGNVEGIVWHCDNKKLFKLHRNHIGLPWPVTEPALSQRKVEVLVDIGSNEIDDEKYFGFTPSSFTQSSKPLVEHVSVIQPKHPVSHYSSDFSDPLHLMDKPRRQKDGHSLFSNTSPASCHSPRHPYNLNPDDILNIAMTGMLAADHDLQYGFPDPGPLPSINTVFMSEADKPCY